MDRDRQYFFCGIGGSGMLPLALTVQALGYRVAGSDRSLDQGRTGAKFDFLKSRGIPLFAQDGSGLSGGGIVLVTSAAVEATVPDVARAKRLGLEHVTRAQLLSELFNAAPCRIGIAGTSGKSTTTGMIGWILHRSGRSPTIVNGAVMKNFATPKSPYASAVAGWADLFVAEVDESDGSIADFCPSVAVLNNVALDHKPLPELRRLFGEFCAKSQTAILNADDPEVLAILSTLPATKCRTYGFQADAPTLKASNIVPAPDGIGFLLTDGRSGAVYPVRLQIPGRHNIANALAALLAAEAAGVSLADGISALAAFSGIQRRLDFIGSANGIAVFDDFAHNPDKISASLAALHDFPGRLLIMFQPHGYGPLKLMKDGFVECFASNLAACDILTMPEPVYFGGTVDREVTSRDIAGAVAAAGRNAVALPDREVCGDVLLKTAGPGDRIVVMGARDDTLSQFARDLLKKVNAGV